MKDKGHAIENLLKKMGLGYNDLGSSCSIVVNTDRDGTRIGDDQFQAELSRGAILEMLQGLEKSGYHASKDEECLEDFWRAIDKAIEKEEGCVKHEKL